MTKKLFLFAAVVLMLASCTQSVPHDKEITYLATFAKETRTTASAINAFWKQMVDAVETANQDADTKLDSAYIVRLKKSCDSATQTLTDAITKLSAMEEIDKDINLKEHTIAQLKDTKMLQENAIPMAIAALANGLDKITPEQKEALIAFKMKGEQLQDGSAKLENLAKEFQSKHKITDEELTAQGL